MMIHLQFAHCPRELIEQTFVTVFGPHLCHLRGRGLAVESLDSRQGQACAKMVLS